jgi:hypothetical protein
MTAESKMRKVSKKLHWGRGGRFLKASVKGIKRLDFFNGSERLKNKRETENTINNE